MADCNLYRLAAGQLKTDGVLIGGVRLQAPQLVSTAPVGTAPLVVTSTTMVPNLNAEFVGGVRGSDLALATHKRHAWSNGEYDFGFFEDQSSMRIYTETSGGDNLRFATPTAVEYWDGAAWVAWIGWESLLSRAIDGSIRTVAEIPRNRRKFRIAWARAMPWPGQVLVVLDCQWSQITFPSPIAITIETHDGVAWQTRDTTTFGPATSGSSYGIHIKATPNLHNGESNTRITVDIPDWTEIEPTYLTFPLRRLMLLHQNLAGVWPAIPFGWDYTKKVTFDAAAAVTGSLTAPTAVFATSLTAAGVAHRGWTNADTDIDALLPGTTAGSIIEGPSSSHIVIGIRSNDADDSFAVMTRDSGNAAYSRLAFRVTADGRVLAGSSQVWHAGNLDPATKSDIGHNHDGRYLQLTGGTITGVLTVSGTSVGRSLVSPGNASNPGYIAFHTSDGTRRGYVGWRDGSNTRLQIASENGWTWDFNAVPTVLGQSVWHAGTFNPASKADVGHTHSHSSMTGLSADDHPQYHNDARGDARYAMTARGLPAGGTTGQVLVKSSSTDYAAAWGNVAFGQLTGIPTTVAGYGITDVYTKTEADGRYLKLTGGTVAGSLNLSNLGADLTSGVGQKLLMKSDTTHQVKPITLAAIKGYLDIQAGDITLLANVPQARLLGRYTAGTGVAQYITIGSGLNLDASGNLTAAGGGGVTDHGALTGLADDDHPQYLNNARGDSRYLQLSGGTVIGNIAFGTSTRQMLSLYDVNYGFGVQPSTLYARTVETFAIHRGGSHVDSEAAPGSGGTTMLRLKATGSIFEAHGNTVWTSGNTPSTRFLPPGGATGQALVKASGGDYDAVWGSPGGASAQLVFASTSEVIFSGSSLTDTTYRTCIGSVRGSATIGSGTLTSGTILRIEMMGTFRAADGYLPNIRITVGGLTCLFAISEPSSGDMQATATWSALVTLLVVSSGSSATVVMRGYFDTGSSVFGITDSVLRTTPSVTGALNTTVANSIAVDYRGNNASMQEFKASHLVATLV